MNKKNEHRLMELLNEIDKIFSSKNPQTYTEIIKDINKELKELLSD